MRGMRENNSQYGSVKARDAMNRRLYEGLIIVETPIHRVFVIYNFHQKTLTEPYWHNSFLFPNPQSPIPY
jgi:hypothetical protein